MWTRVRGRVSYFLVLLARVGTHVCFISWCYMFLLPFVRLRHYAREKLRDNARFCRFLFLCLYLSVLYICFYVRRGDDPPSSHSSFSTYTFFL